MKLSVISDNLTNVIVAACTRTSATPKNGDLALLAGDAVPVFEGKTMTVVGQWPVADLSLTDIDVADPATVSSTLNAPTLFGLATGAPGTTSGTGAPTGTLTPTTFSATLVSPQTGKARLRVTRLSTNDAVSLDADVTPTSTMLTFSFSPPLQAGQDYGCVLLVTGMAALATKQTA